MKNFFLLSAMVSGSMALFSNVAFSQTYKCEIAKQVLFQSPEKPYATFDITIKHGEDPSSVAWKTIQNPDQDTFSFGFAAGDKPGSSYFFCSLARAQQSNAPLSPGITTAILSGSQTLMFSIPRTSDISVMDMVDCERKKRFHFFSYL